MLQRIWKVRTCKQPGARKINEAKTASILVIPEKTTAQALQIPAHAGGLDSDTDTPDAASPELEDLDAEMWETVSEE